MTKFLTFVFCMMSFLASGQSGLQYRHHTGPDSTNAYPKEFVINRIRAIEKTISNTTRTESATPLLRSTTEGKQKLDSITSGLWKEQYTYTPNGNLIRAIRFEINGMGEWTEVYKKEYAYNKFGRLVLTTTYVWENNQWIDTGKENRSYDDLRNEILYTHQIRDTISLKWINYSKEEREFDNNSREISTIHSESDPQSMQWIKKYKYDRTFNSDGKMTREIYSQWNDRSKLWENNTKKEVSYFADETTTIIMKWIEKWINSQKETYTVNSSGKITSYALFEWIDPQWINTQKQEVTFDDSDREVMNSYYRWHAFTSATGELRPESKEETSYDSLGIRAQIIGYRWNSDSSRWDNSFKKECTFDKKGNKLSATKSNWSQNSWQTEYYTTCSYENTDPVLISNEVDRVELMYNNLYSLDEMILPDIYSDYTSWFADPTHFFDTDNIPVKKMVLQYTRYQFDGQNWNIREIIRSYFSPYIVTMIEEPFIPSAFIYDSKLRCVTINCANSSPQLYMEISDTNGQIISSQTVSHLATISISNLKAGEYILKLIDKEKTISKKKIVVE